MLPISALAEETVETEETVIVSETSKSLKSQSGTDGNISWVLDDSGTMTVTGTGAISLDNACDYPWEDELLQSVSKLVIGEGITSIGEGAFSGGAYTSVTLPGTLKSIGVFAFEDCNNLTEVVIPDGVEILKHGAFCGCSNLKKVVIPGSVKTIDARAFDSCTSLSDVTIGEGVETIGYWAFWGCAMTEITVPSSVESLGGRVFECCENLTSVTLPESITTIPAGLFADCSSLTAVTIPTSVTSVESYAFINCDSLKSVSFTGNCPAFADDSFEGVTTTCYYPASNSTWTGDKLQNYGGSVTWKLTGSNLNGVCKGADGSWYYYINGVIQENYTGFQSNSNGKWYIENGKVTFAKNGVIQDTNGTIATKGTWSYVTGRKVQTG
ncbi:MAG: leucine-rich repeat domain-containing protein [Lachnospiraceae bacterium]|nr:leucine-rich repeat domain-containing protein [Lachnospiraceae bacterium]